MYHDKFHFVLKLVQLLTNSILFSLEPIKQYQCCQLCISREIHLFEETHTVNEYYFVQADRDMILIIEPLVPVLF